MAEVFTAAQARNFDNPNTAAEVTTVAVGTAAVQKIGVPAASCTTIVVGAAAPLGLL